MKQTFLFILLLTSCNSKNICLELDRYKVSNSEFKNIIENSNLYFLGNQGETPLQNYQKDKCFIRYWKSENKVVELRYNVFGDVKRIPKRVRLIHVD